MINVNILIDKLELKKTYLSKNETELYSLCPNHDDHNPNNFSINLHTGLCYCFACGFKSSLIKMFFDKGVDYSISIKIWRAIKDSVNREIKLPLLPVDSYLIDFYKQKGFSNVALKRVGDDDLLRKYLVFQDGNDNPVYFVGTKDDVLSISVKYDNQDIPIINPDWRNRGLFIGDHLYSTEYTIVVESLWDAIYLHKITGYKCVAIGGKNLTEYQLQNLKYLSPIIFWYDFDDGGRYARNRTWRLLEKRKDVISYYIGGNYNNLDPDELSEADILKCLDNKKSWLDYKFWLEKK